MIDRQTAISIARCWLNGHSELEIEFLEKDIREEDFGWVFFYDSPTGQIAGNSPLIVDRHDGSVHLTGTARPIEFYLASYRSEKLSKPVLLDRAARGFAEVGHILAEVRLFHARDGGRYSVLPPGFLPCSFEHCDEGFDCRLITSENGPLAPGATATVPVRFLRPDLGMETIQVGTRFTLKDFRRIGEGLVIAIWPGRFREFGPSG